MSENNTDDCLAYRGVSADLANYLYVMHMIEYYWQSERHADYLQGFMHAAKTLCGDDGLREDIEFLLSLKYP